LGGITAEGADTGVCPFTIAGLVVIQHVNLINFQLPFTGFFPMNRTILLNNRIIKLN